MYIGPGTLNVSTSIDVHSDTAMACIVDASGDVELTLGRNPYAMMTITEGGVDKFA